MRVLGIETTCDETAAAVVQLEPGGPGEILSNEIMSQIAEHAAFGGVVPEIAARAHIEIIDRLVELALARSGFDLADLDGIAAAAGPGLIGGVMVGLTTAKALALASHKPFLAINHLEAHALTARLTDELAFPYLLLLVSGGHTQLVAVKGVGDYLRMVRPWTTRPAKPSTRSAKCWVFLILADHGWRPWRARAMPGVSICRGPCLAGRNRTFHFPD